MLFQVLSIGGLIVESALGIMAVSGNTSSANSGSLVLVSLVSLLPAAVYTADQIMQRVDRKWTKPIEGVALPEIWNLPLRR